MRRITKGIGILSGLLLILFAHPSVLQAQNSPQLLFDQANDQLESENYQQALSIYRSLEQQQTISGSLFLNMAISYVNLDSLGKAKYYFMKAGKFEEVSQEAEDGLLYVENGFSRQSPVLPKLPWERLFDWLGNISSPGALLGIGVILLNLGLCSFVAGWFIPSVAKILRISGISTVVLSILFIFSSFYLQYQENRYSEAIMIHQQVNVLEQPRTGSAIVSQAYEGYTFTVDHYESDTAADWIYVRMSNGLYGWIPDSEIMIL